MNKLIKFGEDIEGYTIPVLNEREIRAAAGILFILMFIAIMIVILLGNFVMLKYAISIFLIDILIRVNISPRFSPSLIIGRLIVRNQVPEYVGAQQKKVAWTIGIVLASTVFILQVLVNAYSPITAIICLMCLIFLFFETAFGICIGCKFYTMYYKEPAQYCPAEACATQSKQNIQKTSNLQLFIVFGFIVIVFSFGILFNDFITKPPYDLLGIESMFESD